MLQQWLLFQLELYVLDDTTGNMCTTVHACIKTAVVICNAAQALTHNHQNSTL
jgi:hypothetical protein